MGTCNTYLGGCAARPFIIVHGLFGKQDRFLSQKSFGSHVGAKEVSKMLVLHEFLNLCASSQDLLQSRSFADLTCKHTIYQIDRRPRRLFCLDSRWCSTAMGLFRFLPIRFFRFCFHFNFVLFSQIVMIIVYSNQIISNKAKVTSQNIWIQTEFGPKVYLSSRMLLQDILCLRLKVPKFLGKFNE